MGLTKQYLRWEQANQFGIIASPCQAIAIIRQWPNMQSTERICATAACENIIFWDLKTCQPIEKISTNEASEDPKSSPISCLAYSAVSNVICSGHVDGSVRLFECNDLQLKVIFAGHKGVVTCIAFDSAGLRVASAGKDTEIVLWDVTSQSGMFRLKGHKGSVNKIEFMKNHPWILISASNDTFIKFWDLNTQHCFKTLVGHRSEVWSFVVLKQDSRLVSGSSDSELKVWKIIFAEEDEEKFQEKATELKNRRVEQLELLGEEMVGAEETWNENMDSPLLVEQFGTILRKSSERLTNVLVDSSESVLVCHGKDNYMECFKLRNDEELKTKIKNRLRKERKRRHDDTIPEIDESTLWDYSTLSDEFVKLDVAKTSSKIKFCDMKITKREVGKQELTIAALLINNSIESHLVEIKLNEFVTHESSRISAYGHRHDVRAVSISSDSLSIMTASADSVKVWNKSSCRCIATISENIDYPLGSLFAPGDKHLVLGTKSGKLQVLSLITTQVQSTIGASETGMPIWSICLLPDMTGIVSGSEDRCVKFWAFDFIVNQEDNSRLLTLTEERTLTADDGVICVKVSPNSKFVAVSQLDSTVKIYFCDTFKFFLSLYGHKFPVLCMDISTDNSLIVTGSSDKNIKIWGMDFGDCHRSLFAHDDNIMCLNFVPKTHYLFTASKDHKIKMWDADHYEKIITLTGHHGEIWAMAVAPNGKFLVSASHDKSIRIWSKTNEPLVLEEEKEMEHEREFEKEFEDGIQTVAAGELADKQEVGLAQKKTSKTVRSVERIIESIDIFKVELEKSQLYQQQCQAYEARRGQSNQEKGLSAPVREPVNPHLLVYQTECPYRFMLETMVRVRSNELEESLLELPFNYTRQLLAILSELLARRWDVELVSRCVCFIIRVNFGQITATPSLVTLMNKIKGQMREAISQLYDLVGVNHIGLQYYQSIFESREEVSMFAELLRETRAKKHKKHKSRSSKAPILTWT